MGKGEGCGEGVGQGEGRGAGKGEKGLLAGMCCIILVVLIIVLGAFGLGIAKIVMGAVHIKNCPYEKMIPIYLIVAGCVPFLLGGLRNFKKSGDDDDRSLKEKCDVFSVIGVIGLLFNVAWLICGSVWVFGNYSDIIDGCGGSVDCCNTSLAKFALAVVIIDWIFITLIIFVVVGFCIFAYCMASRPTV